MSKSEPFWQTKSLLDMSHDEWESICDGCAKCCLTKLQDEETDEVVFTDVACELLDGGACRCTDYQNRTARVPDCVAMNSENIQEIVDYVPSTCSYRLLLSGEPLPEWHHLLSGSTDTVHSSGSSARGRVRHVEDIGTDDLESYVIDWA